MSAAPALIAPITVVHVSFLAAMDEYRAEGRGGPNDDSSLGRRLREFADVWPTLDGFTQYVHQVRQEALEEAPRPEGIVPATSLWRIDGAVYLGGIQIRHRLTPWLMDIGGHIGYGVRPSARDRGHATSMLQAAKPYANQLGIDPALVTCDEDNIASRRVIERNGGILEDRRGTKLRFWVPTS